MTLLWASSSTESTNQESTTPTESNISLAELITKETISTTPIYEEETTISSSHQNSSLDSEEVTKQSIDFEEVNPDSTTMPTILDATTIPWTNSTTKSTYQEESTAPTRITTYIPQTETTIVEEETTISPLRIQSTTTRKDFSIGHETEPDIDTTTLLPLVITTEKEVGEFAHEEADTANNMYDTQNHENTVRDIEDVTSAMTERNEIVTEHTDTERSTEAEIITSIADEITTEAYAISNAPGMNINESKTNEVENDESSGLIEAVDNTLDKTETYPTPLEAELIEIEMTEGITSQPTINEKSSEKLPERETTTKYKDLISLGPKVTSEINSIIAISKNEENEESTSTLSEEEPYLTGNNALVTENVEISTELQIEITTTIPNGYKDNEQNPMEEGSGGGEIEINKEHIFEIVQELGNIQEEIETDGKKDALEPATLKEESFEGKNGNIHEEEENIYRQPKNVKMMDPVLNLVSYRTDKSVTKVERISS